MPIFFLLATAGTDESQGLELEGFLESDDDQTNYFADDETSICQSPSASEFEDECIESKCELQLLQFNNTMTSDTFSYLRCLRITPDF